MDRLTSASKARYSLRRLALNLITEEINRLPEGRSALSRIYNIVNQSDPDDLFAHFSDKEIIKFFSNEKDLPKYLTGQSGSPDKPLFKKLKRFLFEEQHHVNPLGQNANAINPRWSDESMYVFHRTLNDFGTGSGSSYMSLLGFDKHTHLNKVHGGKTKQVPFPQLSNEDPELAAVEFYINNLGNQYVAEKYHGDPKTFANQILNTKEGTPLRQALEKSKGNPTKFEGFLRTMNGETLSESVRQMDAETDLLGYEQWGNEGVTERQKEAFRKSRPDLYPVERVGYMGSDGVLRQKLVRGLKKIATPAIGGVGMYLDAQETATRINDFQEDPTLLNAAQVGVQGVVQMINGVSTVVPAFAPVTEQLGLIGEATLMGTDIVESPEESAAAARAVPRPTSMLTGAL